MEMYGVSQVPGEPLDACPALGLRQVWASGHYDASDVAFRTVNNVGPATFMISELNDTAHILAVYASRAGLPQTAQDSLPTGGQP